VATRRSTAIDLGWKSPEHPAGARVVRVVALLPVTTIASVVSLLHGSSLADGPFLTGIALLLLATILTCTPSYAGFAPWVMVAVPVLDLVAICLLCLQPGLDAVGVLVAVPAMWLSGMFRWHGVAAVATLSIVGFAVLGPISNGAAVGGGTQAASLITLAILAAALMVFVLSLTISQLVRLEAQGTELATALGVAERQRRQLDAIVGTVDVALATVEPDGSYLSMNPRHRQFLALAFPRGHHGDAGQTGFVYAADNATALTSDQLPSTRAIQGESFTDSLLWIGEDPLNRRAISASARPMLGSQGDLLGSVLSYHDVTELMTALRVKDDFVALVSHELRTPLTSIMGYLELAEESEEELPTEVVHYLSVAHRNAERLLRLVSDLLTARQSNGSAMRLVLGQVDLSSLVQRTLDEVAERIDTADLELEVAIEHDLHVVADPDRVTQVIDNLLSNALKYTLPGGTISLTLARHGDEVQLCVHDTGIGVSELDQKDLFTNFFQARNATERAIPGIGLGLVISKAIVDAHGGRITLDSEEGLGTSVCVTLPAHVDVPHIPSQFVATVTRP
jgi:two-component system phosphate regulon sensor histidine kinase PhoR